MDIAFMPFTAILTYTVIEFITAFIPSDSKLRSAIPLMSVIVGTILGITFYFIFPDHILSKTLPAAATAGGTSGLAATGGDQALKLISRVKTPAPPPADTQ